MEQRQAINEWGLGLEHKGIQGIPSTNTIFKGLRESSSSLEELKTLSEEEHQQFFNKITEINEIQKWLKIQQNHKGQICIKAIYLKLKETSTSLG